MIFIPGDLPAVLLSFEFLLFLDDLQSWSSAGCVAEF